ncbi:MAG: hypothetical protein N3B16_06000 [Candidatus Aminicenantes bacterium]|nr:hypothetical protein [Candidatus Aminicenantes bacterium]
MSRDKWKKVLEDCFEKLSLIKKCQEETRENFAQFCEFIAEPAFETLGEALKDYGLRTWYKKESSNLIRFEMSFPRSKEIQFSYGIYLPPNSIQMKLKLILRGRRTKDSPMKEWVEPFFESLQPGNILSLSKEELMEDLLIHYRDFMIEALTSSD